MTQNQEWIENNFHGKRVMYGGFALLDHSLLSYANPFEICIVKDLIVAFNFVTYCDKVYHFSNLERFEIKGRQNDAMSQYVYSNMIPHGKCFGRHLRCAHSFDF